MKKGEVRRCIFKNKKKTQTNPNIALLTFVGFFFNIAKLLSSACLDVNHCMTIGRELKEKVKENGMYMQN